MHIPSTDCTIAALRHQAIIPMNFLCTTLAAAYCSLKTMILASRLHEEYV